MANNFWKFDVAVYQTLTHKTQSQSIQHLWCQLMWASLDSSQIDRWLQSLLISTFQPANCLSFTNHTNLVDFSMAESKKQIKKGQENAKKFDKNFLISVRKKPNKPQIKKFCILKNITRREIEFGVEWWFQIFYFLISYANSVFSAKMVRVTIWNYFISELPFFFLFSIKFAL